MVKNLIVAIALFAVVGIVGCGSKTACPCPEKKECDKNNCPVKKDCSKKCCDKEKKEEVK